MTPWDPDEARAWLTRERNLTQRWTLLRDYRAGSRLDGPRQARAKEFFALVEEVRASRS